MTEQQAKAARPVVEVDSPILNSPFEEPAWHWHIQRARQPEKRSGRRPASYFFRVPEGAARGRVARVQDDIFGDAGQGQEELLDLVNDLRQRVRNWREGTITGRPYEGITPVTRELIDLWRSDARMQRLFFAQIEAAETMIFLLEAAEPYRKGMGEVPEDRPASGTDGRRFAFFKRYACKMATGTGKTTVMGMLAAWSILNRVAAPTDDRFSDTILVVCPNVTIRERLKELDPALGDASLYRKRELAPTHRMEELRRGEVIIANWHQLARRESNTVNGVSSRVVKTGEPVEVVRNAGKKNETREICYFESERAWFQRIRQELGTGKGRSPHWIVFNDEAHHAYRRGDVSKDDQSVEDDRNIRDKNTREATVWIEGLDRINRLAAGGRKGIAFCVDLSATPFYIQGSGNEVGKPFPWIVSDFGLLEAIEAGLVKIPQLPGTDTSGQDEAAYFNIWRWVERRAQEDGHHGGMTPQLVMNYASQPINILATDWEREFREWQATAAERHRDPIPPVFIVVCRDTALAKEAYGWLAERKGMYGTPPPLLRNEPGQEVTVRIDSKAMEDIEQGGTKDETRRLRFILDTVGKSEWPGGRVPEEWSELVRKHNDKVSSDDNDGSLQWIDERVPPGKYVRCIVSVAMLTEGWDANNVTHVVGLRPFGSQLLCEQVIGRALRRQSYAFDEEKKRFSEETAQIFGVPFELVPFKVSKPGTPPEEKEIHHIYSVVEKSDYEITVPAVTGYHESGTLDVVVDWEQIPTVTVHPDRIPTEVTLNAYAHPDGSLAAYGPGAQVRLSLAEWRRRFRDQQVAFQLAREVCREWTEDKGSDAVPMHLLFPKVVFAAKRFLHQRLHCQGNTKPCDVLAVGEYMNAAVNALLSGVRKGTQMGSQELPIIERGDAGRRSTLYVDFHTTKPVYPATKCHLNAMVADTGTWEQQAAYALDNHPGVRKWVKNDRLGFDIPYRSSKGMRRRYVPDFIAELDTGLKVIVEIKGQVTDDADTKAKAAERWCKAVTATREWGNWAYVLEDSPPDLVRKLDQWCAGSWDVNKGLLGDSP